MKYRDKIFEKYLDNNQEYYDYGTSAVSEDTIIDTNTTGISFYNQFLNSKEAQYMLEHENLKGEIVMMSPNEYYSECSKYAWPGKTIPVEKLKRERQMDKDTLQHLKNVVQVYKRKLCMPMINYADPGQEGLHRMMVVGELLGWDHKVPVLTVRVADEERAEKEKQKRIEWDIYQDIGRAVSNTLNYNFTSEADFNEQLQWELDKSFRYSDYVKPPIKFTIKQSSDEIWTCTVANVTYEFYAGDIKWKESIDDTDIDDIDSEEDIDDFLARYLGDNWMTEFPDAKSKLMKNESLYETNDSNFVKFEKRCFEIADDLIIQMQQSLLDKYGFEIKLVRDYEDFGDHYIGMFLANEQDNASIFPIAINPNAMYQWYKDNGYDTISHGEMVYAVKSTLWHEVGHGIVSYLSDIFEFDWDEEDVVEEFAQQMCDTNNPNCELIDALNDFEDETLTESFSAQTDSIGNELTQEQIEYFKKSKVRDSNGKLLVVHHGTYWDFDTFEKGDIGFHFGTEKAAKDRQDYIDDYDDEFPDWKIGKYYLNITNYIDCYDMGDWTPHDIVNHLIESRLIPLSDNEITYLQQEIWAKSIKGHNVVEPLRKFLLDKGFDGFMYENAFEDAGSMSFIALKPEQIKSITNKTPTRSKNINEDTDNYESSDHPMKEFRNRWAEITSMSSDNLLNTLNAVTQSSIDPDSPMFLLPNGKILSVAKTIKENGCVLAPTHNSLIDCLIEIYMPDLNWEEISDYDWVIERYTDDFLFELTFKHGWARLNCGRTWMESRFYCVLPNTMTNAQYRTLEEWLIWGEETGRKSVLVYCSDEHACQTYSYNIDFAEDILKKIKRFYSTGQLIEGVASDKYYRLEIIDAFGENCGGLFGSNALWDLVYDDGEEDEYLADLIDELQDNHTVPDKWLGSNARFAFKKNFFNKYKSTIDKLAKYLSEFSYELLIKEVSPPNIVFEDDDQIAYTLELSEDIDDKLSVEEYLKRNFSQQNFGDNGTAYLILKDGTVVSASLHQDILDELSIEGYLNDLKFEYEYPVKVLGCFRMGCADDYENYIEIPQTATREQLKSLYDWLDYDDLLNYDGIQLCRDTDSHNYDLNELRDAGEDIPAYILSRIKRYIASGKFYD